MLLGLFVAALANEPFGPRNETKTANFTTGYGFRKQGFSTIQIQEQMATVASPAYCI